MIFKKSIFNKKNSVWRSNPTVRFVSFRYPPCLNGFPVAKQGTGTEGKKQMKKEMKKQMKERSELKALISQESILNNPKELKIFFNQCFDKGRLKNFVLWFLAKYGENKTVELVEQLKNVGFYYASKAGISLGIDDLKIPPKKANLIYEAEKLTSDTIRQYMRGEITGVERFQRLIDTWHRTSEVLKQEVIDHFEETDVLNPVYMMAFSGARGNISQVRQLVGMRGLMADPQGQILDFPIRSNFREGLTLTEYIISSYGARKGIVDTALRTANAGYLTRRLVDVAQHVIISNFDCGTKRGIFLTHMKEGNKIIHSLSQRIVGRILARDLFITNSSNNSSNVDSKTPVSRSERSESLRKNQREGEQEQGIGMKVKIASRNEEITANLAFKITKNFDKVFVRSSLTCEKLICQLCYGWSLAQGKLVSIGEAVGVVAAQSIGEPGTQLTMRTFHTGGVFSGDISDQIKAPFDGIIEYVSGIPGTLIRTPEGKIAFLTKSDGSFLIKNEQQEKRQYKIPPFTILYMRNGQNVYEKEVIAQISSISQKTNATDVAEFTIKSDIEGQFYSKSLGFREKMVGPKLKKSNNSNPLFHNLEYDMIYEAWTWGYAWILSGKIYEFKKPSPLFPIIGDLLNTKSFMTQIKWSLNYNSPYKQQTFRASSQLVIATNSNTIFFEYIKRTPTNSYLKILTTEKNWSHFPQHQVNQVNNEFISNYKNNLKTKKRNDLNKSIKSYPLKGSQILSFDVNKITFKKYGYMMEISKKNQFISFLKPQHLNTKNKLNSDYSSHFFKKMTTSNNILQKQGNFDLVFFIKLTPNSINKNTVPNSILLSKTNLSGKKIKKLDSNLFNQKEKMVKKTQFLAKTYLDQFPYFLQWFPQNYKTKTPGIAIFENINLIDINKFSNNTEIPFKQMKSKQPTFILSQIQMLFDPNKKYKAQERKQHILFKERLNFLKNQKTNMSRIFWLPSYVFKVSNLITYSNFLYLNSYKNSKHRSFKSIENNSNIQSNENNLNSFFNIYLHKKIPVFKTNRQGQNVLFNTNFENNRNYLVKIKKSILTYELPVGTQSNTQANPFVFNNKTNFNLSNKNVTNSLNSISNTNVYHFTSLESYCNLLESLPNISKVSRNLVNTQNSNPFEFLSNISSPLFENAEQTKREKQEQQHQIKQSTFRLQVQKYKNLLIRKNRSLFLLKAIYTLTLPFVFSSASQSETEGLLASTRRPTGRSTVAKPQVFFHFKLSNILELDFRRNKKIKNKLKFSDFLASSQIYHDFNLNLHNLKTQNENNFPRSENKFFIHEKFNNHGFNNHQLNDVSHNITPKYIPNILQKNGYNLKSFKISEKIKMNYFYHPKSKSIKNLKSLLNLKFYQKKLNTNYSQNERIEKHQIDRLNSLLNKNSFLVTRNMIFSVFNKIKTIKTFSNSKCKLGNSKFINSFSFRAQTKILNSFDYCVNPFQSYLVLKNSINNLNKIHFNNSLNYLNQSKNIQTNTLFHTTLKKGWVLVIPPYIKSKSVFQFINKTKKLIYPGQKLYSNILFNKPVITESLLFTQVFNINNIKRLSSDSMSELKNQHFEINNINSSSLKKETKNLNWIKNENCRFYLKNKEGENLNKIVSVLSNPAVRKAHGTNQIKDFQTNTVSVGFLIQSIQEYQQFDNFEIKNYVYEANKTSFNLLDRHKKLINISRNYVIKNKKRSVNCTFDSYNTEKNVSLTGQKMPHMFLKSLKKYEFLKNYLVSKVNFRSKKDKFQTINSSFDSLLKKRLFKTKNYLNYSFKFGNKKLSFSSKYQWEMNTIVSNFIRFLIKNKGLTKQIKINPNLFINKTFFQNTDWNKIGLFKNNAYYSHRSSLLSKQPKEDFNVMSNLLVQNYLQQYSNINSFSNKSSLFSTTNRVDKSFANSVILAGDQNSSYFSQQSSEKWNQKTFFIYSRKSLNLAPFLITYKNLEKIPMTFSKKQFFKLSYLPLSNFDLALDPILSTKLTNILNTYLIESHQRVNNLIKTENSYNNKKQISHQKDNQILFYSTFNDLVHNLFEAPCFSFYLVQSFEFSFLTTTKEQSTEFYYVKNSISSLTTILQKNNLKQHIGQSLPNQKDAELLASNDLFISQADAQTHFYSPFEGELVYIQNKVPFSESESEKINNDFPNSTNVTSTNRDSVEKLPIVPFNYGCMFLTKQNLISYYLPSTHMNKKIQTFSDFFKLQTDSNYKIKETLIKFLTMTEIQNFQYFNKIKNISLDQNQVKINTAFNLSNMNMGKPNIRGSAFRKINYLQALKNFNSQKIFNNSNSTSLLGDFYVYGDTLSESELIHEQKAIRISGQIIHYNLNKITLRRAQPIFISPKGVLHKLDGEFIDPKTPVITLSYERLKTGDIIQGIPKVEQFFEARTTKRGRLFRDSLPSLLKALFKRYQSKMPLELAVRQSFYKIQQIIVDGVHRVYKSQGVTISDKHLEVIVKQMTCKVRILDGAQTGFFPGEVVDIYFVEKINQFLIKKITYEPLVLGITKASLEVDSFLSAASFQQTTKVLSQAAIYRKKDFLKGLKENVILGNLIPAGTGYLVYVDDLLLKKEF